MPVILHNKDQQAWLQGAAYEDLTYPYEVKLTAQKI